MLIAGWRPRQGSRAEAIGSLLLGVPGPKGLEYVWQVGTGGEVQFSEWTRDGRLRHPSWRGLRPDKSGHEVVRESSS